MTVECLRQRVLRRINPEARISEWEFDNDTGECRRAADFLREKHTAPKNPGDFAMLAVKITRL
jgi:hypothetical protein